MRRLAAFFVLSSLVVSCTPPSRRGEQHPPQVAEVPPPPPPTQPPPPATYAPPLPPPPVVQPIRQIPRPVIAKVTPKPAETAKPAPPKPPPTPSVPGCGEVDVDGVNVPLDCFTKDYVRVQGASSAVARASLVASTPPPDYVDHRRDKVEGPVRTQRSVGCGVAMALAGAIDQALARNGVQAAPVSAMALWARAPSPNLGQVVNASLGKGIPAEATMPFDEARACSWATPEAARLCKAPSKAAPGADDLAKADSAPIAKLAELVEVDATNGDALRGTLSRSQDVLVVLRVDPDAWRAVVKSSDAEPLVPDYVGTSGVQTVLLVGYAKQDNVYYYLIKNSWGPAWGRDGYAWVAEPTLKKNVIESYVVQANPPSGPTAGVGGTTCPAGQVPDAGNKQCAPPCPDNSPRTNGVCPDASKGACPPGFVNITGQCVVAAPDRKGSDATTGVSFVCGSAGCTYTWKKGAAVECAQQVCSLSCPAPKFLAAINPAKKTIACTE